MHQARDRAIVERAGPARDGQWLNLRSIRGPSTGERKSLRQNRDLSDDCSGAAAFLFFLRWSPMDRNPPITACILYVYHNNDVVEALWLGVRRKETAYYVDIQQLLSISLERITT